MKKHLFIAVVSLSITSCSILHIPDPNKLDSKTRRFKAKPNTEVIVISEIAVNADTLKTLLIVPNGDYFYEMGKNLEYFDEVMTYGQFESKIKEIDNSFENTTYRDKLQLNRAAKLYRPFVIMKAQTTQQDENHHWFAGITIYDPLRVETIFQNKKYVKYVSSFDNGYYTWSPLYNNLLEYLRKQQ